jgi:hypothetical protein
MLATYASELASTGRLSMRRFQMLSPGKTGQPPMLGAPLLVGTTVAGGGAVGVAVGVALDAPVAVKVLVAVVVANAVAVRVAVRVQVDVGELVGVRVGVRVAVARGLRNLVAASTRSALSGTDRKARAASEDVRRWFIAISFARMRRKSPRAHLRQTKGVPRDESGPTCSFPPVVR